MSSWQADRIVLFRHYTLSMAYDVMEQSASHGRARRCQALQ